MFTSAASTFYGFSATMASSGNTFFYQPGDRVEFPEVITNVGGGYNSSNNEFTCPVSGIYFFSASARTQPGDKAYFRIKLDDVKVVTSIVDAITLTKGAHSTSIVIVECTAGQKVWCNCHYQTCTIYGSTAHYTVFSGMLVHLV